MSGNLVGNNIITGSLINGSTFSSSSYGTIVFDGSNDYINIGSSITLTNSFSICMFCRVNAVTGGNILGFYGVSPFIGWGLGFGQTPLSGPQINFWDGNTWKNPEINIVDGRMKHICVVISDTYLLSFYINGAFVNSVQGAAISVYSGTKAISARSDGAGPMNGAISNVRLYNRMLSPSEILQNYNALKGRFGLD
jgi:hypothetical protein